MSMNSIDLTQFDAGYRNEAPAERPDRDSVPDGKYQVVVEKVELAEAHSTGNPMLKWTLRILAPTQINRLLWRSAWAAIRGRRIIAVGVQLGNVEFLSNRNGDMLRQLPAAAKTRGERAAAAVDFINGRFGAGAITYGVNQPHPGFFERG